jgi:hypothetical protein
MDFFDNVGSGRSVCPFINQGSPGHFLNGRSLAGSGYAGSQYFKDLLQLKLRA